MLLMPMNPLLALETSPRNSGLFVVPRTQMSSVSGKDANGVTIATESLCESLTWNERSIGLDTEIFASVFYLLRRLVMALLKSEMILSSELGVISMSRSLR